MSARSIAVNRSSTVGSTRSLHVRSNVTLAHTFDSGNRLPRAYDGYNRVIR